MPFLKTLLLKQLEKKESIYNSHQRKPLGTYPNPQKNFPEGMNFNETIFGIKSEEGSRAKACLNPQKNYDEIEKEYEDKRDLYRSSHLSYNVSCNKSPSRNLLLKKKFLGRRTEATRLYCSSI